MPSDRTDTLLKSTSTARRTSRKTLEDEELELRRIRGEVSCAECRRLKLRCDKKVPCNSCVRRGCPTICPVGSLSSGQGTRFILADTKELHHKISEMSNRIRQLEDALAITYASLSSDRHPLLSDELIKIKFGSEAIETLNPEEREETSHNLDAFGTLTLGDKDEFKYYGRSAGSETLLLAGEDWAHDSSDEEEVPSVSPEIARLADIFPFTTKRTNIRNTVWLLISHLPPESRAWDLCSRYMDHASWFFRPLVRDELIYDVMTPIYKINQDGGNLNHPTHCCPHKLGLLFFTFAIGALMDLDLPPYNAEAERYYDLGRAALSLRSVFDSPQVQTVQAVGLMASYHALAGKNYTRDSVWSIMSLAAKLAQSIGLHRDGTRWNLDSRTVHRRRNLFWEVFSADVSHSLALGRPPSIHLSYVDCEFPKDEDEMISDTGEVQQGFWRWKYTFSKDVFLAVAEATLTAKSPSYAIILDLDRKVRQMSFPPSYKPYPSPEDRDYHVPSSTMRAFYLSQHRMITMLYLHRSFFAQALLDYPSNPLASPFGPSCLTAYRCSSIIIRAHVHQFQRCPELVMRAWTLLTHTFSAAVIVGSIVTRTPNSNMAPSAMIELGLAVEIFEKSAIHCSRAGIALHVLRRLREKAAHAYAQYRTGNFSSQEPTSLPREDDTEDELAIFGGQVRILPSKLLSSKRQANSPHLSDSTSTTSSTLDSTDVHTLPSHSPTGAINHVTSSYFSSSISNPHPPYANPEPHVYSVETQQNTYSWYSQPEHSLAVAADYASTGHYVSNHSTAMQCPTAPAYNASGADEVQTIGLTLEAGMDDQWVTFVRQTGIFDGGYNDTIGLG